eukprot:4833180-Pleurochrysis_carterae.AAC.1
MHARPSMPTRAFAPSVRARRRLAQSAMPPPPSDDNPDARRSHRKVTLARSRSPQPTYIRVRVDNVTTTRKPGGSTPAAH